jgi:hypothetical protein
VLFTAVEQFTHRAFPALHENHVCRGPVNAFGNRKRDRGIKQQLFLGGKRTLSGAHRQNLGLEFIMLIVWSSIRPRKTSLSTLWRNRNPPKRKKSTDIFCWPSRSTDRFRKFSPDIPEEEIAILLRTTRDEQP